MSCSPLIASYEKHINAKETLNYARRAARNVTTG